MTTMPNAMNNHTPMSMSTPINNLPLKTSQSEQDIDDPMIQNVLKEFENEMIGNTPPEQTYQIHVPQPSQQQIPELAQHTPQYVNQQNIQAQEGIKFNSVTKKSLVNIEIAKKAMIITALMYLIYSSNVLQYVMKMLPASVLVHISGKECILNTLMIFSIIYSLMYFELL